MDASIIEQHVKAVERDGFTVIPDAIEPGLVADLRANDLGSCQAGGISGLAWDLNELPPSGGTYFYLIRPANPGCGEGSLGFDSLGRLRAVAVGGACP